MRGGLLDEFRKRMDSFIRSYRITKSILGIKTRTRSVGAF